MSEESGDPKKSRLESVIPGILKRGMEKAVEKTLEAPADLKSFVTDMKLPKEIAHYIFSQVDETKNGLFRVVGHEVRDFLEHTNFAGEMQKILTTVQFEINTTIRFRPNEGEKHSAKGDEGSSTDESSTEERKSNRPEVKTNVTVRRDRAEREERRRRQRASGAPEQGRDENSEKSGKSDKTDKDSDD